MYALILLTVLLALGTSVSTEEPASGIQKKDGMTAEKYLRSLFVYEEGKREPWSAANVTALCVCLLVAALLALSCLWCRHHESADPETGLPSTSAFHDV